MAQGKPRSSKEKYLSRMKSCQPAGLRPPLSTGRANPLKLTNFCALYRRLPLEKASGGAQPAVSSEDFRSMFRQPALIRCISHKFSPALEAKLLHGAPLVGLYAFYANV